MKISSFRYLPSDLTTLRIRCNKCGRDFPIPFLDEQSHSLKPVKPLDHDPISNNRYWVLGAMEVPCPSCSGRGRVQIPTTTKKAEIHLFGDEAMRNHDRRKVFTYSLIGADPRLLRKVEDAVAQLKQKVAPNLAPESWRMHMTEAWSSESRRDHSAYRGWDLPQVIDYVEEILNLFEQLQDILFVLNVSIAESGKENSMRDLAYTALLMNTLELFTKKGTQPHFIFDSDRLTNDGCATVGWAERMLKVRQKTLLYAFLARGLVIPEPRFIDPGSHPCLELADFVSFWIARYHLKKWQGKDLELDLTRLGRAFYLGMCNNGNLAFCIQEGFPWDTFYG